MGDERITPHDAAELSMCFKHHAPGLFGHACVLARGDKALAEDLVQTTFEAAGRVWPTLRGLADAQLRAWLSSTLAHIAASSFRPEAVFRDRLPRIEVGYRKTPAGPPEQAFSSIALERCWRIIQDMPERQYAIALLRWRLDMKETEIAAAFDIAPSTVSAQLHQARRKLIAQLGSEWGPS